MESVEVSEIKNLASNLFEIHSKIVKTDDLLNIVKEKTREFNKLQKKHTTLSNTYSQLKSEHTTALNEINELKKRFHTTTREHLEYINNAESNKITLNQEIEELKKKIKERMNKRASQVQPYLNEIDSLKVECELYKNELNELNDTHKNYIDNLNENHKNEINKLNDSHRNEKEEIINKYEYEKIILTKKIKHKHVKVKNTSEISIQTDDNISKNFNESLSLPPFFDLITENVKQFSSTQTQTDEIVPLNINSPPKPEIYDQISLKDIFEEVNMPSLLSPMSSIDETPEKYEYGTQTDLEITKPILFDSSSQTNCFNTQSISTQTESELLEIKFIKPLETPLSKSIFIRKNLSTKLKKELQLLSKIRKKYKIYKNKLLYSFRKSKLNMENVLQNYMNHGNVPLVYISPKYASFSNNKFSNRENATNNPWNVQFNQNPLNLLMNMLFTQSLFSSNNMSSNNFAHVQQPFVTPSNNYIYQNCNIGTNIFKRKRNNDDDFKFKSKRKKSFGCDYDDKKCHCKKETLETFDNFKYEKFSFSKAKNNDNDDDIKDSSLLCKKIDTFDKSVSMNSDLIKGHNLPVVNNTDESCTINISNDAGNIISEEALKLVDLLSSTPGNRNDDGDNNKSSVENPTKKQSENANKINLNVDFNLQINKNQSNLQENLEKNEKPKSNVNFEEEIKEMLSPLVKLISESVLAIKEKNKTCDTNQDVNKNVNIDKSLENDKMNETVHKSVENNFTQVKISDFNNTSLITNEQHLNNSTNCSVIKQNPTNKSLEKDNMIDKKSLNNRTKIKCTKNNSCELSDYDKTRLTLFGSLSDDDDDDSDGNDTPVEISISSINKFKSNTKHKDVKKISNQVISENEKPKYSINLTKTSEYINDMFSKQHLEIESNNTNIMFKKPQTSLGSNGQQQMVVKTKPIPLEKRNSPEMKINNSTKSNIDCINVVKNKSPTIIKKAVDKSPPLLKEKEKLKVNPVLGNLSGLSSQNQQHFVHSKVTSSLENSTNTYKHLNSIQIEDNTPTTNVENSKTFSIEDQKLNNKLSTDLKCVKQITVDTKIVPLENQNKSRVNISNDQLQNNNVNMPIISVEKDSIFSLENPVKNLKQQNNTMHVVKIQKSLPENTGMKLSFIKKMISDVATKDWDEKLATTVISTLMKQNLILIAHLIINEAVKDYSQEYDKSYTPPAPLMTLTQQKLLVLITRLETEGVDNFITIFLNEAEKKLLTEKFIRNINSLTRLFIALCKLNYDIERVRLFCCHAAYYMGDLFIPVMFITLTMWGDILPMAEVGNEIPLTIALVQVIQSKKFSKPGFNLTNLNQLLTNYYQYKRGEKTNDQILNQLVTLFIENPLKSTYTALLILCKNMPGTSRISFLTKHILPVIEQYKNNSEKQILLKILFKLINNIRNMFHVVNEKDHINQINNWLIKMVAVGIIGTNGS